VKAIRSTKYGAFLLHYTLIHQIHQKLTVLRKEMELWEKKILDLWNGCCLFFIVKREQLRTKGWALLYVYHPCNISFLWKVKIWGRYIFSYFK
jgi:hypothetical protein